MFPILCLLELIHMSVIQSLPHDSMRVELTWSNPEAIHHIIVAISTTIPSFTSTTVPIPTRHTRSEEKQDMGSYLFLQV